MEPTETPTTAGGQQPSPLSVSRSFPAARETVFKAWSSADQVKRWFSPETYSVPNARVDLHVGGCFDVCMRAPDGHEHWMRGTFVEIVPYDRLVIQARVIGDEGGELFRACTVVTFTDDAVGTRMDVAQTYTFTSPAEAAPMVAGAPEGWRTTLDKLQKEIARVTGSREAARSVVHATFEVERTYDAPVSRVWAAITDETAKSRWFAGPPDKWKLQERHMDVRAGGRERLKGRWASGMVSSFDAIYHDVVPNERLVYTYEMHLDETRISVSLATMQLRAEGGKTTLTITEQGVFLDGYDDAGSREQGTGQLLEMLGASLNS